MALTGHHIGEGHALRSARERISELERRLTRVIAHGTSLEGKVVQILGGSPPKLRVLVDQRQLDLRYHSAYAPTVGDTVIVTASQVGWFVLGKLA